MRQETARISLWKRTEAGIAGRLYLRHTNVESISDTAPTLTFLCFDI